MLLKTLETIKTSHILHKKKKIITSHKTFSG